MLKYVWLLAKECTTLKKWEKIDRGQLTIPLPNFSEYNTMILAPALFLMKMLEDIKLF